MSLRVVHVLDSLNLGGAEMQCVMLVRALAARGIESRLVHFRSGPLRSELDGSGVIAEPMALDGFLGRGLPRFVGRLARALLMWRADVVQTYSYYTNLPGLLGGRLAGVPVLVAGKRGEGIGLRPAQRFVDRLARRLAHATVVNTDALRAQLRAEDGDRRVAVIRNCVVARGAVTPSQDPVVGMVANFRPPKDHATFLRAAALVAERVPTAEFHLVGAGSHEACARQLVADLGLASRVRFLGALDPAGVWAAVNRFAVSVLSSLSEGLPNVVLESMVAARPVVATAVGGVAEIVRDGVTGFVVPVRDPVALAEPIARLLKDPQSAACMGAAARAYALRAHGPDRMVDDVLELYRTLAADRGRA